MTVNPLLMQERTVLVTGASSGIGRAAAILLSELEARVVLVGRDLPRLEETRSLMQGSGHVVEAFDLTNADAIPDWLKQIVVQTGPLHGLVHSAGIQQTIPLRMTTAAKIEALMRVNVTSAMMLVKAFRQKGCTVRNGSIVLLSSVAGIAGQTAISAYSASKAALMGFARSAAVELAPDGLRINCIAPGYVETEMAIQFREQLPPGQFEMIGRLHPLGIGKPLDVAHSIAFLLADTGRWITGTTLVIDGGYTAH
jgi:NAD(P)-dependent dehydrogenase (short-subunit alcohol dehydrogenase family)